MMGSTLRASPGGRCASRTAGLTVPALQVLLQCRHALADSLQPERSQVAGEGVGELLALEQDGKLHV
jgi:hypothetical protein